MSNTSVQTSGKYSYKAYGLNIASDIALPELVPAKEHQNSVDVRIIRGLPGSEDYARANRGMNFPGVIKNVGKFFMREGKDLFLKPLPGVSEERLRPSILGPLFSILLRQRGLIVLHASCVEIDGEAVAFIGDCGAGKSTTTEAFYRSGCKILCDDVLAIDHKNGQFFALPGTPQIKLRADAAEALENGDQLPRLFDQSQRRVLMASENFSSESAPLSRIYILEFGDDLREVHVDPLKAFTQLLRHSRAIPPLTAPAFLQAQLSECERLRQLVPTRVLMRPKSLAVLDDVVHFVQEQVQEGPFTPESLECASVGTGADG